MAAAGTGIIAGEPFVIGSDCAAAPPGQAFFGLPVNLRVFLGNQANYA
jgi:hypothetical protein